VSVLSRDGAGGFTLALFYEVAAGGDGLGSMVSVDGKVYVRTGSQTIVELDETATEVATNLWPATSSRDPGALAVDVKGDLFGGDLLVAEAGPLGRIHRMDRETDTWSTLGNLVFEFPIYGMAVSPVDGDLYVAERDGNIWRVTAN
jgi:DNA-binding beta-propeller fold protein YncE